MAKEGELTQKQRRFCEEYLIDLNATQAAIRSGYSENTAQAIGSENLTKPLIVAFIKQKQEELSEKTSITTEWVIKRLKEISDRCMTAVPVMFREGKNLVQATDENGEGVWEFDSSGANRSTELLGKHVGVFEKDNKQKVSESKQEITLPGGTKISI